MGFLRMIGQTLGETGGRQDRYAYRLGSHSFTGQAAAPEALAA